MPRTSGSPGLRRRAPGMLLSMDERRVGILVTRLLRRSVRSRAGVLLPAVERAGHRAVAFVPGGIGRDGHVAHRLTSDLAEDGRGDNTSVLGPDRVADSDE